MGTLVAFGGSMGLSGYIPVYVCVTRVLKHGRIRDPPSDP